MQLYYWKSLEGNFGDDLNEWLWDELLPGWREWDSDVTLVGVGTILNSGHFPINRPGRFLVLGSGVGNGSPPNISNKSKWDIRSLRGPISASNLGLPQRIGIIDPAVMIPTLSSFRDIKKSSRPVFVPHISSVDNFDWPELCNSIGVDYVSPRDESRGVIKRLAGAPLVIAESMHAAIIADAFRTPWIATHISSKFNAEKWSDWSSGMEFNLRIHPMFPWTERLKSGSKSSASSEVMMSSTPNRKIFVHSSMKRRVRLWVEAALAKRALGRLLGVSPTLSSETTLRTQQDKYKAMLAGVVNDYGK